MSSRRRKQEVREMAARARARQIEERRPYSEIYELLKNGTDEELVARIDRAVAEGSDIMHHLDKYRYALIHTAALENRPAAFVPLLRAGFTVDGREFDGKGTPLHIAANCGSAEAAKELIRLGADVNARGFDDKAPLHCAACYTKETDEKKFETIKILLDAGADPHAKDVFRLEPVNWFGTRRAQRRFLTLIGEESDSLPPRYAFTRDYDGQLVLAINDISLWYGKSDD